MTPPVSPPPPVKLTTEERVIAGFDAAMRSLIPVVLVIAGLVMAGTIENWHDIFSLKGLAAIVVAVAAKGTHGAVTA